MKGWHDALLVGLCLALIWSFVGATLSRMFLSEKADEGRRWKRAMESAVPLPVDPRELRTPVVLPTERRTREQYDDDVSIDWDAASPQERAESVLEALPQWFEGEVGISATLAAQKLGQSVQAVVPVLQGLVDDGRARCHWEIHKGHKRRAYWRA